MAAIVTMTTRDHTYKDLLDLRRLCRILVAMGTQCPLTDNSWKKKNAERVEPGDTPTHEVTHLIVLVTAGSHVVVTYDGMVAKCFLYMDRKR